MNLIHDKDDKVCRNHAHVCMNCFTSMHEFTIKHDFHITCSCTLRWRFCVSLNFWIDRPIISMRNSNSMIASTPHSYLIMVCAQCHVSLLATPNFTTFQPGSLSGFQTGIATYEFLFILTTLLVRGKANSLWIQFDEEIRIKICPRVHELVYKHWILHIFYSIKWSLDSCSRAHT